MNHSLENPFIHDISQVILERMPQKVFCKDLHLRYIFCNRAYADDHHRTPQEIRGKTDYELFPRDLAQKYRRDDKKVLDEKKPAHLEETYIHNGQPRIVHTYKTPLRDNQRNIIGLLGIFWDITHHRHIEDLLAQSTRNHHMLVETANSIILRMDTRGNIVYFNTFAERFFGYRRKDLLGKNVVGTIVPKEETTGRDLRAMIRNIGKEPERYAANENENMRKNGERVWVLWSNKGLCDANGKLTEILCIGNDITQLKETKEALAASESKYRSMIETSPASIVILNRGGFVTDCNSVTEKLSGYRKDEIIGRHFSKIGGFKVKDLPELFTLFTNAKKGIFPQSLEIECIRKDKTLVTVEARGSRLENGSIQIIASDITERKKSREKLKKAYEELKTTQVQLIQSSKMAAIGQLAAGISHELNQPLTGIRALAQSLSGKPDDPRKIKKYLEQIIEQTDRMARIIKNVRFFSRKAEFRMKQINPHRPLSQAILLINKQLKDRGITLKQTLAAGIPPVRGDENLLQQVFLNLLTNAGDAIEQCGRRGKGIIHITSRYKKQTHQIEITVSDNGSGIAKKDMPHIFNPFFTTKAPQKGMGLGLSIAYRIIEQHHGTLSFRVASERNTTAAIVLPAYTVPKRRKRRL